MTKSGRPFTVKDDGGSPRLSRHRGGAGGYVRSIVSACIIGVMGKSDEPDPIDEAIRQLHRAGWSIGDTAFTTEARVVAWVVSGTNGENLIRAEGSTRAEAWIRAVDQARSLGMLGT
jgi:hypothetical protein